MRRLLTKKSNTNVEYRKQSSEETTQATKDTFTESPVTAVSHPEVEAQFARYRQASRLDAVIEVEKFPSIDAMIQSLEPANMLGEVNFMQRMQFKKGLQNVEISMKQMAFDEFRILRVETLDSDEKLA